MREYIDYKEFKEKLEKMLKRAEYYNNRHAAEAIKVFLNIAEAMKRSS